MVTHNLHVRFALLACLLACLVGWLLKKLIGLVCWEGKRTKVQGMSRICGRCGRYITVFAKKKKKSCVDEGGAKAIGYMGVVSLKV